MEKEEKTDKIFKSMLRHRASRHHISESCPGEEEWVDFLAKRSSPEREEELLGHCAACQRCLDALALASQAKEGSQEKASLEMLARAQNIAAAKSTSFLSRRKWPLSAFICFILSFIVTRYFVQFLVLAVIFSLKWIFDSGSTRTLIMIYEAWRKKDSETTQEIIRGFKEHIEKRS